MYLKRRVYVGNEYRDPEQRVRVTIPEDQSGCTFPTPEFDDNQISEIVLRVGYWRKANAIHRWFVENVQGGVDDCREYYVSGDKLRELLKLAKESVNAVLNGKEPVLETQSGFFFGSTEYDDWYVEDMKETVRILSSLDLDDGDYYYQSPW